MYKYFEVGLEIQEEVASIFLIFLCWFPEHRLSTPSKCTLEIRRLVIDNFLNLWYLVIVWSFIILGSFVIFQMSLNPWAGCEGYTEYERALELMVVRYCLNVGMEGIGMLVIRYCPKFNMSILLQQFQFLLVPSFGWLIF